MARIGEAARGGCGFSAALDPNVARVDHSDHGEPRRTALEPRLASLITDAGKVDFAALEESPAPVTDEEGRTAFARVGGRVGVVASDGTASFVSGPTCSSPAALAPAGPRRMVVGCRDGTVMLVGDEAP